MATQVKIKGNYLDYCAERVSFEGIHNRRKVLILWALSRYEPLTSYEVYTVIGQDCTLSCVRSTVSRLLKYEYISRSAGYYKLRTKGMRFLYAARHLAPLQQWVEEIKLANGIDNSSVH